MDVHVQARRGWWDTASAFHARRPLTLRTIMANVGELASAALDVTGLPVGQTTNPIPRVTREDVDDLRPDTDVLINVLAPRPDLDDTGRRKYITTIMLEIAKGVQALLGDDPPLFTVRVRLVEECEATFIIDGVKPGSVYGAAAASRPSAI